MTDETTTPETVEQAVEATAPASESDAKSTSTGDILNELNRFANQIVSTVQAAWASPKRKEVTDELETGFTELTKTIDTAFKQARESKIGHDVSDTATKAAETVKQSKVIDDVRDVLVATLKDANVRLEKFSEKLSQTGKPHEATPAAEAPPAPAEAEAVVEKAEVVEANTPWYQEAIDAEAAGEEKPA
jgi:hypothetical protein